jgi:hypothetical protein
MCAVTDKQRNADKQETPHLVTPLWPAEKYILQLEKTGKNSCLKNDNTQKIC